MALVEIADLHKSYEHEGRTLPILKGIDLTIDAGEVLAIVGFSGAGKSTLLHCICTLDLPSSGTIRLDGQDATRLPGPRLAALRNQTIGFVFQFHHLLPEFTALENVAMPGLIQGKTLKQMEPRALALLEEVGLQPRIRHRPGELSGGEQQRVALARALVLEPTVLLLDEPLGALDAQLRARLQVELAALQRRVGITFVYVTHDQHEAFTMSDRIGVMREGRLLQVGAPREIYERPANVDVARFVGAANLVHGAVTARGVADLSGERFAVPDDAPLGEAIVMVRPERIRIGAGSRAARIERVTFAGAALRVDLRVGDVALVAEVPNDDRSSALRAGDATTIDVPADAVRVLSPRRS